jgi:hypothetical protein
VGFPARGFKGKGKRLAGGSVSLSEEDQDWNEEDEDWSGEDTGEEESD